MQGARPIKPSKGKSFRGKTVFLKKRKMVYWESTLERDCVRLCDYHPHVADMDHQPFCLEYTHRGRRHIYYPDYRLLIFGQGVVIVEVKLLKRVKDEKNLIKFEVGRRYCREMGWQYWIMTEKQIRLGRYFQSNLRMLRGLGNETIPGEYVQFVFSRLALVGMCSIHELRGRCRDLPDDSSFYMALYKLLYFQKIYADIVHQKITAATVISIRPASDLICELK